MEYKQIVNINVDKMGSKINKNVIVTVVAYTHIDNQQPPTLNTQRTRTLKLHTPATIRVHIYTLHNRCATTDTLLQ